MKKKINKINEEVKDFINDFYSISPRYRTKAMLKQMMTSFIDKEKRSVKIFSINKERQRIWEEVTKPNTFKFKTGQLVKMVPLHFIKDVLKLYE